MLKRFMFLTALGCAIGFFAAICVAEDRGQVQDRERQQVQTSDQERLQDQDMYGWQLMTPQEREEHRKKMRSLKTYEERETYRLEHHMEMQERAREQGIILPGMPQPQGGGTGYKGGGMGPHDGMGGGGGGRGRR